MNHFFFFSEAEQVAVNDFLCLAQKAYVAGGKSLLRKMALTNKLLKSASSLDPIARGHHVTLKALLDLPDQVTSVRDVININDYNKEARLYQIDEKLPDHSKPVDQWWMTVQSTSKYPNLCKMALALVTCFHGPAVESSFNIMKDIMSGRSCNTAVQTYSAIQTIKYRLREPCAPKEAAVSYFLKKDPVFDHPNRLLCRNMLSAYKRSQEAKKEQQATSTTQATGPSKRKARELAVESSKRARTCHFQDVLARRAKRVAVARALRKERRSKL